MSEPTVVVLVKRNCYIGGELRSVSEEVTVPALAAADLIASRRCALVDLAQLPVVEAAVVAEQHRQGHAAGSGPGRIHDGWMRIS